MTTNYWEPKAEPRTQTYTFTVSTFNASTDYTLLFQDPDYTSYQFTISCSPSDEGVTTIDGVVNALLARFEECIHPFKSRVSLTATGTVGSYTGFTIEATVAGMPFTVTDTSDPSGSTTLTATIANQGPYDVNLAANWSLGHIPATGEDIEFKNYDKGPCVNVAALQAIVLASATFDMTHTGLVGGEFAAFKLNLTGKLIAGAGSVSETALGSPRLNIELVSTNNEAEILNSCVTSEDENQPTVRLKMSGATGKCRVRKAKMLLTVAGTLGTVEVSTITADSDTYLTISEGATITSFTQYSGNTILKGTSPTCFVYGGVFEHIGSQALGTITVGTNGKAYLSSSGNVTAVLSSGVVNMRMNSTPRSVGTCTLYQGYELYAYHDIHTFTNGLVFSGCKVAEGILEIGQNYRLTPAVVS